jgi:ribosomal protein S17E
MAKLESKRLRNPVAKYCQHMASASRRCPTGKMPMPRLFLLSAGGYFA